MSIEESSKIRCILLESVNATSNTQMYLDFSCMDVIGPLNLAVFRTDEIHRHNNRPQFCKPINHSFMRAAQPFIPIKPLECAAEECAANFYAVQNSIVSQDRRIGCPFVNTSMYWLPEAAIIYITFSPQPLVSAYGCMCACAGM